MCVKKKKAEDGSWVHEDVKLRLDWDFYRKAGMFVLDWKFEI